MLRGLDYYVLLSRRSDDARRVKVYSGWLVCQAQSPIAIPRSGCICCPNRIFAPHNHATRQPPTATLLNIADHPGSVGP